MRIHDIDTDEIFEISKEQIANLQKSAVTELTSQGLLDILTWFAGSRGKNGQKRSFEYADDWQEEKDNLILDYDNCNKDISDSRKELDDLKGTNKQLLTEKEQLNKRLDEIRDMTYMNDQKINEISLGTIPEKERLLYEIENKFDETAGTKNINMWR